VDALHVAQPGADAGKASADLPSPEPAVPALTGTCWGLVGRETSPSHPRPCSPAARAGLSASAQLCAWPQARRHGVAGVSSNARSPESQGKGAQICPPRSLLFCFLEGEGLCKDLRNLGKVFEMPLPTPVMHRHRLPPSRQTDGRTDSRDQHQGPVRESQGPADPRGS